METERKFLVISEKLSPLPIGAFIEQGYLAFQDPPRVPIELRLRRVNRTDCFLTVKSGTAPTRLEVELAIEPDQFAQLWPLTEGRRVFKSRHRICLANGSTAELDVYQGRHSGLQTVEVEFSSESEAGDFAPPPWFGPEVTGESRYANAELAG
jgi:adenylate cyclase